jgi:hypothetical protein
MQVKLDHDMRKLQLHNSRGALKQRDWELIEGVPAVPGDRFFDFWLQTLAAWPVPSIQSWHCDWSLMDITAIINRYIRLGEDDLTSPLGAVSASTSSPHASRSTPASKVSGRTVLFPQRRGRPLQPWKI